MKGMGFPSKIPMFDAMRVTNEVHSIGHVILKFVSHYLTKAFAWEILILLTMAYKMINSPLRTGRTSSLGKGVMANHLCIKWRVGFCMSLHRGANLAWTTCPEIWTQNSWWLTPRQACSREIGQRLLKSRWLAKVFQKKMILLPEKSKVYPHFPSPEECKRIGWWGVENHTPQQAQSCPIQLHGKH